MYRVVCYSHALGLTSPPFNHLLTLFLSAWRFTMRCLTGTYNFFMSSHIFILVIHFSTVYSASPFIDAEWKIKIIRVSNHLPLKESTGSRFLFLDWSFGFGKRCSVIDCRATRNFYCVRDQTPLPIEFFLTKHNGCFAEKSTVFFSHRKNRLME